MSFYVSFYFQGDRLVEQIIFSILNTCIACAVVSLLVHHFPASISTALCPHTTLTVHVFCFFGWYHLHLN